MGSLSRALPKEVAFLEGTSCEIQAVTTSAPGSVKFVFVPPGGVPSKAAARFGLSEVSASLTPPK